MMNCCMWTPKRILDCCTEDGKPVDCFDVAIPVDNPYREELKNYCWAKWEFAVCNNQCVDAWLLRLTNLCRLIDRTYVTKIGVYEENISKISHLGTEDTEVRESTHVSTPDGSDTFVATNENIPATQNAASEEWLSDRQKQTSTPGVVITDTDSETVTRTHTAPVAETLRDVMDAVRDPYAEYADELTELFAPVWVW